MFAQEQTEHTQYLVSLVHLICISIISCVKRLMSSNKKLRLKQDIIH